MATSPAPAGGTLKRDKGWMGTLTRRSRKAEKEGKMSDISFIYFWLVLVSSLGIG